MPACQRNRTGRSNLKTARTAEKATAFSALIWPNGAGRKIGHALLKLANARVGLPQSLLLYEHRLHQQVGRVGNLPDRVTDQLIRIAVLRNGLDILQTVKQTGDQLPLLGGHGDFPFNRDVRSFRLEQPIDIFNALSVVADVTITMKVHRTPYGAVAGALQMRKATQFYELLVPMLPLM